MSEPIKDKNKINQVLKSLKKNDYRVYLMAAISINTGIKINDLRGLRNESGLIVQNKLVNCFDEKTGEFVHRLITAYVQDRNIAAGKLLFESGKVNGNPLSRIQIYRVLVKAGQSCELSPLSSETIRKTFGYWYVTEGGDIEALRGIFGNRSKVATLRFIGGEVLKPEKATLAFK